MYGFVMHTQCGHPPIAILIKATFIPGCTYMPIPAVWSNGCVAELLPSGDYLQLKQMH